MASRIPDNDQPVASAEKLFEEFARRQKRGETVSLEEYCERYPERSIALRLMAAVPPESLAEALDTVPGALGSIGKYQLVRSLGRGGFGEVYLARQPSPQREVALKVLKPGMDTREILARFERERQALAVLSHPNIATIFEAGETEQGRPYFVMEYVPGKPATDYCREEGLGLRERLAIFLKICGAVQHAHQHGILHRDLKPLNILVASRDGGTPEPKIIDFGLAKALDVDLAGESMATQDGCLMGTPMYIAPEQVDSRAPVDRRADVYALGVVLYELLTDDRPFHYSAPLRYDELLRIVAEEDPLPPSRCATRMGRTGDDASFKAPTSARELRGELDWITMKALEKDPLRRYSSASDLASDVACYLNGEPIVAGPPSGIYRLRKLARKHRWEFAGALAIALIVAYPLYNYVSGRLLVGRLVALANASYRDYVDLAEDVERLYTTWRDRQRSTVSWAPVWERREEIETWRRLVQLNERLHPRHVLAVQDISQAQRVDLPDAERDRLSRELDEVLSTRLALLEMETDFPASAPSVLSAGYRVYSTVALRSEPAGADVYCFRYEEREARWVPLPFNPESGRHDSDRGVTEIEFLLVDRLWPRKEDKVKPPFEVGDRIFEVNGAKTRSMGDLARVLSMIRSDQSVGVKLLRSGETRSVTWTPFSPGRVDLLRRALRHYDRPPDSIRPGRLVDPFLQLGITFSACLLEFVPANLVGKTTESGPLRLRVPAGSYLFVLRKSGYVDTRVPVATTASQISELVRLVERERVPEGFVYVPAGKLATGGDPRADQSFESGSRDVDAFFMKRLELTSAEWLEFLNDEDVRERIDPLTGTAEPRHPDVVAELRVLKGEGRVQLVPARNGKQYLRRSDIGTWEFQRETLGLYNPDWPAQLISQHAALEYVHWRNERARRSGEPWVFRLPTDPEWERAARGVDRRHYVWGNYPVWSFCRSQQGVLLPQAQAPGINTFDESIFGIRGMAGSVREHTTGQPFGRFRTCRGGSYDQVSDVYFRLASRNGFLPENWIWDHGVRLVAEWRES